MNESDRDLVFSETVKAGKRIYYFDVRQTRHGDHYLTITESKKIMDEASEEPHITFERHKLFLYKEDYEKFMKGLNRALSVAKSGVFPKKEDQSAKAEPVKVKSEPIVSVQLSSEPKEEPDGYKIDLDF